LPQVKKKKAARFKLKWKKMSGLDEITLAQAEWMEV